MGKRRVAGLLVLTMGLLLGICNTVMPTAFGFMAMCGIILVIGISIWMLRRCGSADVMADPSAALTGCIWSIMLGVGLVAGICKQSTERSMHPYDEAAYDMIIVLCLLLALIVWLLDMTVNKKKHSFRRVLLQCGITIGLAPAVMGPARILMLVFEIIFSGYV